VLNDLKESRLRFLLFQCFCLLLSPMVVLKRRPVRNQRRLAIGRLHLYLPAVVALMCPVLAGIKHTKPFVTNLIVLNWSSTGNVTARLSFCEISNNSELYIYGITITIDCIKLS
jgi:hypothetical protein